MTKAEEIITKVSRDLQKLTQLVTGNGSIEGSIMHRVKILEIKDMEILEKIDIAINRPCVYKEAIEKEEALKEKHRNFRIGDIANVIQLVLLFLVVYGMFIQ
jgi:hypothetical protein